MDANSLIIMIFFYLKKGQDEKFLEYENRVLPLLKIYEGELIFRIRPGKAAFSNWAGEVPFEIHMLAFKSRDSLSKYLEDESRVKNAHLFQESVRKTILFEGSIEQISHFEE